MGRLCPQNHKRFAQAMPGQLDFTFAGAEANVAVSLAALGATAAFVTALPDNALGHSCIQTLRGLGVDTSGILPTRLGRLGLYFVEKGANQRPSVVIYDRECSSLALTPARDFDWQNIFLDATWLHVSGITPALSRMAFESTLAAVRAARASGMMISFDLNFRKKLWRWQEGETAKALAARCLRQVLPFVDLVIANEQDAADVLGIRAEDSDVEKGRLAVERYPLVAQEIVKQFPSVKRVAITLRTSISASHNNWGAMLYETATGKAYFAPESNGRFSPYEIRNIVDRVGTGDSFAAALIFALNTAELSAPQTAVGFAAAASCLAHSIEGDFNYSNRQEVEALMNGNASGRVVR